jgi:hypothetical protein
VCELEAEREDEGQHTFDKGLAISKEPKIGRFVLKINRDGPVFAGLAGCIVYGASIIVLAT